MPDRPSQDGLFLGKNGQAGHHWYTGDQPDNMSGAGVILSLFNSRWRNYLILLDFFACTILFDVLSTVYSVSINIQLIDGCSTNFVPPMMITTTWFALVRNGWSIYIWFMCKLHIRLNQIKKNSPMFSVTDCIYTFSWTCISTDSKHLLIDAFRFRQRFRGC